MVAVPTMWAPLSYVCCFINPMNIHELVRYLRIINRRETTELCGPQLAAVSYDRTSKQFLVAGLGWIPWRGSSRCAASGYQNMGEQTERCGNFNHLWMMFRRQTDRFSTSTSRFYLSVVETSDENTWENTFKKRTCNTTSKHTMVAKSCIS